MKIQNWLLGAAVAAFVVPLTAAAQDSCPNRGDLDALFCDANRDMVADTPADAARQRNPNTLVFSYTPIEDPAVYEKLLQPFTDHLSKCTGKRVAFFQVQSNAAQIEAMRSGRLHVAAFSTGAAPFAVNIAGAVPFAVRGAAEGAQGYHLIVVVRKDSSIQKLADLKGRKVAHTSPSSNSGHLAPLALFPKQGVTPDKDYKVIFSGKHDQSLMGVKTGDYDAAAVTSDVFRRMTQRGQLKADDFRVIYRSERFPNAAFSYAHDLAPALRDKVVGCFMNFRFTDEMKQNFEGSDRFIPATYKAEWALVRDVAEASGQHFNRAAYEREAAKAGKK